MHEPSIEVNFVGTNLARCMARLWKRELLLAMAGVVMACAGRVAPAPHDSVMASDAVPASAEPVKLADGPTFLVPNF